MALPLKYHWRNLFVRITTTSLTVLVIAAVVGTLCWLIGLKVSLRGALDGASDARKIVVLRRGSTSENSSVITVTDFNKLSQLAGVARDPQSNEPLISPEMMVQVALPRLRDGGKTTANVAIRAVTERAFQVHSTVKVLGRSFSIGAPEVIVGVKAADQFKGLCEGDIVNLGFGNNRGYKVVGFFTAGGGPMESEIWGYLPSLMNTYNRPVYSAVNLRLSDGADPQATINQIESPPIELSAKTEQDYWTYQTKRINIYLSIVGGLVCVMALAAVFSIANTMFAAVAGRTREIAMLRTIGFGQRHILLGFVIEAVLLALIGGTIGCLGCGAWLGLVGHTKDMIGNTNFSALAFEIRLTPLTMGLALTIVTLIGAAGAFVPAWRASRLQILTALRG